MKQFIILCMLLPVFAFGQNSSGKIIFTEKIKFDIQLPEGEEKMKGMFPEHQTVTKELLFNEKASLYQDEEKLGEEQRTQEFNSDEGGAQINIKMVRPEHVIYKDLQKGNKVELKEIFGKKFLVVDALEDFQWKLSGQQKEILGYTCFEATHSDSLRYVTAWFAGTIPVSSGPVEYGKLPGMILELDLNRGERTYTATKLDLMPVSEDLLVPPSKGKEVTQAEYDKIRDEKMKEMKAEYGGDGKGIRIITRERND